MMIIANKAEQKMPSFRDWITNMEQPMPWPHKMRLLFRNISIRIQKRSDCCGHPGEPGC
jgi:hypothetical protein